MILGCHCIYPHKLRYLTNENAAHSQNALTPQCSQSPGENERKNDGKQKRAADLLLLLQQHHFFDHRSRYGCYWNPSQALRGWERAPNPSSESLTTMCGRVTNKREQKGFAQPPIETKPQLMSFELNWSSPCAA
jgi:hypothetical protein